MKTIGNGLSLLVTLLFSAGGAAVGEERIAELGNGRLVFEAETGTYSTIEWCADLGESNWHDGWMSLQGIAITSALTDVSVPFFYRISSTTDYYDNCTALQDTLMTQIRAELQGPGWWSALSRLASFQAWISNRVATLEQGSTLVQVPGFGTVEYASMGHGPLFLMLHGGMMGYDTICIMSNIAQAGFTVICPSRPGFLRTPLLPGTNDSFELAADMLSGLLNVLGVTNRVIIGATSAGGPTALQFVLRHPDRTAALVMMSAVSKTYMAEIPEIDNFLIPLILPDTDQDVKSWKLMLGTERYPEETLYQWFTLVVQSNDVYRRELARQIAQDPVGVEHLLQFTCGITPIRLRYDGTINDDTLMAFLPDYPLESITNPVFVSHSYCDGDVHFEHATNLYDRVSGPKTNFYFSGCGHLYFLGPEWADIQQHLLEFMNQYNPGFP